MKFLHGKNILLTRTVEQNNTTATLVKRVGAAPVLFPCIHIEYLTKNIAFALKELKNNTHKNVDIIFSSCNGVKAVAACTKHLSHDLQGFRVVAVGRKTAQVLTTRGCPPELIPDEASQQGLIQAYQHTTLPNHAYFFRAQEGSDDLLGFLQQQGVHTHLIPSYTAYCNPKDAALTIKQLSNKQVDAVLLGSAKTAQFYVQRIADLELANMPVIAVMSPQVEKAADNSGLKVQVIANKPSFSAMLQGLDDYFATQDKG